MGRRCAACRLAPSFYGATTQLGMSVPIQETEFNIAGDKGSIASWVARLRFNLGTRMRNLMNQDRVRSELTASGRNALSSASDSLSLGLLQVQPV